MPRSIPRLHLTSFRLLVDLSTHIVASFNALLSSSRDLKGRTGKQKESPSRPLLAEGNSRTEFRGSDIQGKTKGIPPPGPFWLRPTAALNFGGSDKYDRLANHLSKTFQTFELERSKHTLNGTIELKKYNFTALILFSCSVIIIPQQKVSKHVRISFRSFARA